MWQLGICFLGVADRIGRRLARLAKDASCGGHAVEFEVSGNGIRFVWYTRAWGIEDSGDRAGVLGDSVEARSGKGVIPASG